MPGQRDTSSAPCLRVPGQNIHQQQQHAPVSLRLHPEAARRRNRRRNPQHRVSQYCNNPGSPHLPVRPRKRGRYRLEFLLRERDRPSWEESSWFPSGESTLLTE